MQSCGTGVHTSAILHIDMRAWVRSHPGTFLAGYTVFSPKAVVGKRFADRFCRYSRQTLWYRDTSRRQTCALQCGIYLTTSFCSLAGVSGVA